MIKCFILTVLFVTGCLCRTIPDDIPVSDNPEEQTSLASEASKSENTQELSTEVSVGDKEIIANSEIPEQSSESKSANSENAESKDIQARSTEDAATVNSENTEEPVGKINLDDVMTISPENSDVSSTADANDSKGDEVTRTSRNSESNSSAEVKSASVETETGEDASHIHVKEQTKQAPSEEDGSSQTEASEEKSTSASAENEPKAESDGESKIADEESQVRTGSPEENEQSSSDTDKDNKKSSEAHGDDLGLIGHAADALIGPPVNRRMFNDYNQQHDEVEKHSSEAPDTKTAPQEGTPSSGHQIHSNYLGGSRAAHSQYPYSPSEESTSPKHSSAKESSADPVISSGLPITKLRTGNPDISFQNPNQNDHLRPRVLPLLPQVAHPPHHPSDVYRPLPQLPHPQTYEQYKRPPLPPPMQTYKPLQLPTPERFFPLPQQLEHVPIFKPDCVRGGCNNPPIQYWQPQQVFPKLLSPFPARTAMKTMHTLNPLNSNPNMYSMFRQAVPEVLPLSDAFSGSWNAFQGTPAAVSSSARSHASAFSSF